MVREMEKWSGIRIREQSIRAKAHSKELITKTAQLTDNDYLVRMLYKNIY